MIRNIFLIIILIGLSSGALSQEIKIQDKDLPTKIDLSSLLNSNPNNICKVPLAFDIENSGTISKLTNIGNAKTLNVDNNGGIINQNFVFVQLDNQTYYSPQQSEALHRKNFEEITGIKADLITEISSLKSEIQQWNKNLVQYIDELSKVSDENPKKLEGFKILRKYKDNIETANCLSDDYVDEALVDEDDKGNKDYLFDLEKIKNDPNYFFVDEEFEGFSVAKKFNKYGYLNWNDQDFSSKFKYTHCRPFKNGYGVAEDDYHYYIINQSGKEILSFDIENVDYIEILSNENFIIHKNEKLKNSSYFINAKGDVLSKKYNDITSYSSNTFLGVSIVKSKKKSKNIDVKPLISSLFTYFEDTDSIKEIYSFIGSNGNDLSSQLNCRRELRGILKFNDYCNDFHINQVTMINTQEVLFGLHSGERFQSKFQLVLKDIKKNAIIDFAKDVDYGFYYPLDNFAIPVNGSRSVRGSLQYDVSDRIILGYDSKSIRKFKATPILKSDYTFDIERKIVDKPIKYYYDFSNKKKIGESCNDLIGVLSEYDLLVFGNNLKTDSKTEEIIVTHQLNEMNDSMNFDSLYGYGVMDFNGLYLIPPIFKHVEYNNKGIQKFFVLKSYFNDEEFKITVKGECIENCIKYRTLFRNYFPVHEKIKELNNEGFGIPVRD